jgi:DNA-binding NarL/FixJ family response regulator
MQWIEAEMARIRCMLVEDQAMFLGLLQQVLQFLPGLRVVATASTAAEAITALETLLPDLLILDLSLPDRPGVEVAEQLQLRRPDARLIVLSGQASSFVCPPQLHPMLHAVIDKTSAFHDLRQEIDRLLQVPSAVEGDSARPEDLLGTLTPRERDVLALMGQGCSSKAIAQALGMALATVHTHRRNLGAKLKLSGAELVRLAVIEASES